MDTVSADANSTLADFRSVTVSVALQIKALSALPFPLLAVLEDVSSEPQACHVPCVFLSKCDKHASIHQINGRLVDAKASVAHFHRICNINKGYLVYSKFGE